MALARRGKQPDLTGLLRERQGGSWLQPLRNRAWARALRDQPLTPEDRLRGFAQTGFTPHGLYRPTDRARNDALDARLRAIGAIADKDACWSAYLALQAETADWEAQGLSGAWTGQQALARSLARFRIAGWGRRGGKTYYAANEAVAVAVQRPRSTIWCCAPIMKLVSRAFDMVWEIIEDQHIPRTIARNGPQEKYIQLENGSRIEGMSLENVWSAAGASVNLAIIDEAAQITPEAWYRGVMPPLADCQGQALLLSSWEGREGFFYEQARKAEEQGLEEWAVFRQLSWENFFAFQQGEDSPAIQQAKRVTPPLDFLEQYGAVPAQARNLVYPQFKPAVHVGDYPFDPRFEVILAVDPSKGANEYAVAAIQRDPDHGRVWVFDEYYTIGAMAEDVTSALDKRPWRPAVTHVVVDNADPNEILRWNLAGFPAFAVEDKPHPELRYPIVRRLLRDPARYWPFHERKLLEILTKHGLTLAEFKAMKSEEQHTILLDLEQGLSDLHLTPADIADLRGCAHFFVNRPCAGVIDEFLQYTYQKRRQINISPSERGRKYKDHLMDAIGYFAWVFEREEYLRAQDAEGEWSALGLREDGPLVPPPQEPLPAHLLAAPTEGSGSGGETAAVRGQRWLDTVRSALLPEVDLAYIEETWD